MANKRIKDLATSITTFRTGDVIAVDGPDGTAKMSKNTLLELTAQNALAGNVAPEFDPTKANDAGGYAYYYNQRVVKDGLVYRFIKNHSSGAWDASEVKRVTEEDIADELNGSWKEWSGHVGKMIGTPVMASVPYPTRSVPKTDSSFFNDSSSNPHWWGSGYIAIPNGVKKIAYRGIKFYQSGPAAITPLAFYDENKVFISCVPVPLSGTFIPTEGVIDVPNDAVYFIQSAYIDSNEPTKESHNYTYYFYDADYDVTKIGEIDGIKSEVADNSSNIAELNSVVTGGDDKPVGATGTQTASNTSYIWFQYSEQKHVTRIRFRCYTGTTYFYKVTYVEGAATLTYDLITSVVNSSSENGSIKSVDVDVVLGKNEYIGINGAFRFKDSSDYFTRNYNISMGAISGKTGQYLDFAAEYADSVDERLDDIDAEIDALENKRPFRPYGEATLYQHTFNATSADFVGTQTITDGELVITAGDNISDSRIYLNKMYSITDRTVKYTCKFSATGKARFEVLGSNGSSTSLELVVDASAKTILGNGDIGLMSCPILNTSDYFVFSFSKYYLNLVIDVANLYTGETWSTTYTASGTGGVGDGAIDVANKKNVSMQHCYYSISASNGGVVKIKRMVVTCAKTSLLIYGDSITEGEAYWPKSLFKDHWCQKIVEKANQNAVTSGWSGQSFANVYACMQNEIPYIKPKYVMITLGTNGGDSVANYTTMVQYVKAQGCTPILNHIPCYNNNGNTTGFRTSNSNIDSVRTSESVRGADFDKATSTDHEGQNVDTGKMWYEQYADSYYYHHPNAEGCAAMFLQLLMDVPEVFDLTLE